MVKYILFKIVIFYLAKLHYYPGELKRMADYLCEPEEAFIHTAEMIAIKAAVREIQRREDMRWVICTN